VVSGTSVALNAILQALTVVLIDRWGEYNKSTNRLRVHCHSRVDARIGLW
jgi:hypothetical protein